VWSALVFGFGGFRDDYGHFSIDPRLPEGWESLEFNVTLQGYQVRVTVEEDAVELKIVDGGEGLVGPGTVMGKEVVGGTRPVRVEGETTLVADEQGLVEAGIATDVVQDIVTVDK